MKEKLRKEIKERLFGLSVFKDAETVLFYISKRMPQRIIIKKTCILN